MRDEEKKNYKEMAANVYKQHEDERKKFKDKAAELEKKKREEKENEKERERQLKREATKQAKWDGKIHRKKDETQAEFTKRLALFNLPKAKKKPNVFRSHTIIKK